MPASYGLTELGVIMDIQKDKQIDILMAQLTERYSALHNMRDRSTNFGLWILGFGLGMSWLLIKKDVVLTNFQMWLVAIFIFVVGVLSINFIRAINRGFNNNLSIATKIETALKLYEQDYYELKETVLPKDFSKRRFRWSGHFFTLYSLMVAVFLFLIFLTFINPSQIVSQCDNIQSQPEQQMPSQPFQSEQLIRSQP